MVKKAKRKAKKTRATKPVAPKWRPIEVGDFVSFPDGSKILCGTVVDKKGALILVDAVVPAAPMSEWWLAQIGHPAIERWPHSTRPAYASFKMFASWAKRLVEVP